MKKLLLLSAVIVFLAAIGCKKNETPEPETNNAQTAVPLSFTLIKAQKDGILLGEETIITAEATGENLTYNWQATAGTVVGQGAQVSYGSTCNSCRGENTVSCTVSDGKTNETKSIIISIR